MVLVALHLLFARLLDAGHVAVGAFAVAFVPIALVSRRRTARRPMLRSTAMTPAAACPRTWRSDALAIALITGAICSAHAFGELRSGGLSIPCISGLAIAIVGSLVTVAVSLARTRRRGWSGGCTALLATVAAIAGAIAMDLADAAMQRATGLDFLWGIGKEPWSAGTIAFCGFMQGTLFAGLWGLTVEYPRAMDEARRRTTEAERALREAELARLRGCLEPHFLLNALHAVAGLVDDEPRVARRLLAALGDLYRDALSRSEEVQTLGAEVAWLRRYAEILEARHAGALAFKWEIDRDAEHLPVPTLLLQPLVENAVKHGALAIDGAGEVVVRARVDVDAHRGRSLECVVEDDGPGPAPPGADHAARPWGADVPSRDGAHGLSIVKQRLAVRYGDRASFTLEKREGRTRAVVRLPAMVPS